ncbi:MAG: ABC transporter permease [Actinomycetia bacterium]|nr:ABC transporter permease [Actinomycetes bacterium]
MELILKGLSRALDMLTSADPELVTILWLSLKVSVGAVVLALAIGLPIGTWLALGRFRGQKLLVALANAGMGLPPVVVGLTVAVLLWRSGPLGSWSLLYTPTAMVLAQLVIALPIVIALTISAIQSLDPRIRLEAMSLGASTIQMVSVLWREARLGIMAAAMAGFGGAISEVGAVLMVGGNIRGQTRVMTTAIVTETRMGHFDIAIALGILLLLLVFLANLVLTYLQQRQRYD